MAKRFDKKATKDTLATLNTDFVVQGEVQFLNAIECHSDVLCVKYAPGYEHVAVGLSDGGIDVYRMSSGKRTRVLLDPQKDRPHKPVTCIKNRLARKGGLRTITATYVDGSIRCWDISTGNLVYRLKEDRQTLGLAYHPDLAKFVSVGGDGKIFLYDEETSKLETVYEPTDRRDKLDGHMSRVFTACFHPEYKHEFITGGWDNTVHVWDMRESHSMRYAYGPHVCGGGLDINNTGTEFSSFAWQRASPHQIWDYNSCSLKTSSKGYKSKLYCGKYIARDAIILGGTEPPIVRMISRRNLGVIVSMRPFVGVYDLDTGPMPKRKSIVKDEAGDAVLYPKVVFCCGNGVFEFEVL